MSLSGAGETVFLTVAGSHAFSNDVHDNSDVVCIVLYKTAPTWLQSSLNPAMHVQWPQRTGPHCLTATQVL